MMESKCMNPVIYFDELDKISETPKGEEIIHMLTHLTDPSQNAYDDSVFCVFWSSIYRSITNFMKIGALYPFEN